MIYELLRKITKRIFDQPALYHGLRTLFLGGLPWSHLLRLLESNGTDVIVDIGCGTGTIAEKITFKKYFGFDNDPKAIRVALKRSIPNASFFLKNINQLGLQEIQPTKAILSGILHHLSNQEAQWLLNAIGRSISKFVVTLDPIFLKGRFLNNLLCRLDRGQYVRTREEMLSLLAQTNLAIDAEVYYSSNTKITGYASYRLVPEKKD